MNDIEYKRERVRQARLERLGSNQPQCLICLENDPGCLELHHVAGKVFGDEQVIVCRNCHRKLTDLQKEQPISKREGHSRLERDGHLLLGIADILKIARSQQVLIDLVQRAGMQMIEESEFSNAID